MLDQSRTIGYMFIFLFFLVLYAEMTKSEFASLFLPNDRKEHPVDEDGRCRIQPFTATQGQRHCFASFEQWSY